MFILIPCNATRFSFGSYCNNVVNLKVWTEFLEFTSAANMKDYLRMIT